MRRSRHGSTYLARLSALAFGAALVLTMVGSAGAATKQAVGARISLFVGPTSFPAATAFHIKHGFLLGPTDEVIGKYEFKLDVDGAPRSSDFVEKTTFADGSFSRLWVFNFPAGMSGSHTFTGHFFVPCLTVIDCAGARPNTPMEVLTLTKTVTFP